MTDDLIERLSSDLAPVSARAPDRRLAGVALAGMLVAGAIMVPWIGLRADYPAAFGDPVFWLKFGFTLLLAAAGWGAARRLARPAGQAGRPLIVMLVTVAALAAGGVAQLLMSPGDARALFLGSTALVCPFYITALSLPVLAGTLWVMRRLAPTDLVAAGFAAGLLAGGAGAFVYAFHCGENGLAFVAIWYSLGVLAVGLLGALVGRFALRW
jgi:hypothetical protein